MAPLARSRGAQCIAGYPVGGGSRFSKTRETPVGETVDFVPASNRTSADVADRDGASTPSRTRSAAPEHPFEPAGDSQRALRVVDSMAPMGSGTSATLDDLQRREQQHAPSSASQLEPESSRKLAKTKLCFDFRRGRCKDSECKFAHGRSELRFVNGVHKTSLCRWWAAGKCRADDSCRYAHGEEELRCASITSSEQSTLSNQVGPTSSSDLQVDNVEGRASSLFGESAHGPFRLNPSGGDAVLRVKGTFLEVAPVDAGLPLMKRLSRTWSDDGPGRCAQRTVNGAKPDEACDNGVRTRAGTSFSSRSASFISDMPMVATNSNAGESCERTVRLASVVDSRGASLD